MGKIIKAIRSLPAKNTPWGRKAKSLTAEEGWEVVMAYRSGKTLTDISKAIGVHPSNLYQKVGIWAFRHCGRK